MGKDKLVGDIITCDGEVVGTIYKGDRIVRKKSIDKVVETDKWEVVNFILGNADELELIQSDLTQDEKAFLFAIQYYVSYESCHLMYKNRVDVGTEDLVKITGFSRNHAYSIINNLIKKDILYRGQNSRTRQYFVNPWLFCKGNRINKVLKAMFGNYKIRSRGNIKWKDLR